MQTIVEEQKTVKKQKIAVILFNLGGPDNLQAVKPFLFNLFKDKNIIPLPAIARYPLAWLISTLRTKKAMGIYEKLGGRSPIYPQTLAQAQALMATFTDHEHYEVKAYPCMRYWMPFTHDVITEIKQDAPDKIVLLPLYPQFSTTTTQSSLEEWHLLSQEYALNIPTETICCYPDEDLFVNAYACLIKEHIEKNNLGTTDTPVQIIFSAHGIPQDCVDKFKDPYQSHVEQSVSAIVEKLKNDTIYFKHQISYQSKVGPKKWLLPNTETVIEACSKAKKNIVIVPIAFVSEHSETLVELDMDYQELATDLGVGTYVRVPTVGTHPLFIQSLSSMVTRILEHPQECSKICDEKFTACCQRLGQKNTQNQSIRY